MPHAAVLFPRLRPVNATLHRYHHSSPFIPAPRTYGVRCTSNCAARLPSIPVLRWLSGPMGPGRSSPPSVVRRLRPFAVVACPSAIIVVMLAKDLWVLSLWSLEHPSRSDEPKCAVRLRVVRHRHVCVCTECDRSPNTAGRWSVLILFQILGTGQYHILLSLFHSVWKKESDVDSES